jgi:glycerate kinase
MKIVIAPDSFKETLSASEVASAIESSFQNVFPDAESVSLKESGAMTIFIMKN